MATERREILQLTKKYLSYQKDVYRGEFIFQKSDLLAGQQDALQIFFQSVQDCQKCELARSRKHLVFGDGNSQANLMLVGEAPGREEDLKGEPFVGKAGQLLDKILAAIGFGRDEVYIANILKCRPPQNRDPLPEEVAACLPHLVGQIEIIKPRILIALGRISAQVLLDTSEPMNRIRGTLHTTRGIPLIATYHPAALLRNPKWKRLVWEDVQRVRNLYDEIVGDKPPWQPPKK